jgi:hypothetical protein
VIDESFQVHNPAGHGKFQKLFKHSHEFERRGFQNWHSLGNKLAAANVAGKDCTVRLISKSNISSIINYTKFTPVRSCLSSMQCFEAYCFPCPCRV